MFVATRRVRSVACERVSSGVRLIEPAPTMTAAANVPAMRQGKTLANASPQARRQSEMTPPTARTMSARCVGGYPLGQGIGYRPPVDPGSGTDSAMPESGASEGFCAGLSAARPQTSPVRRMAACR